MLQRVVVSRPHKLVDVLQPLAYKRGWRGVSALINFDAVHDSRSVLLNRYQQNVIEMSAIPSRDHAER